MNSVSIKISPPVNGYAALYTLAGAVIKGMTANSRFPAPSPPLSALLAAANELSDALNAWGPPNNRGSKTDFVRLQVAAADLRNKLTLEASYVMNKLDRTLPVTDQMAFIASSGFEAKKQKAPQGVLQAPQNVHQVRNKNSNPYEPQLAWRKPLGLLSRKNVKQYEVYRGRTADFSNAVLAGITTVTKFTDKKAPRGGSLYYFVAGRNAAGLGVLSEAIVVPMYA